MENCTFNIKRFGKYFISDLKRCWNNFGLGLILLSVASFPAAFVVENIFHLIDRHEWIGFNGDTASWVFIIAVFAIVAAMPAQCYGKITEKRYGTYWLTIPASKMEKFTSMATLCTLSTIIGVLGYWSTVMIIGALDTNHQLYIGDFFYSDFNDIISIILASLAIIFSFIWGAIFFKKAKVAKTALTGFAVVLTVFMLFMHLYNVGILDRLSRNGEYLLMDIVFLIYNCAVLYAIYRRICSLRH